MSEPRKEDNPQPIRPMISNRVFLFIVGVIIIGTSVYVILNIYYPEEEPIPIQQIPPSVVPIETEPVKEIKFNIANFDRCVDMLIDYVKSYGIANDPLTVSEKTKLNDILSQYYELGCNLVENQLSSTDKYKHRNDIDQ